LLTSWYFEDLSESNDEIESSNSDVGDDEDTHNFPPALPSPPLALDDMDDDHGDDVSDSNEVPSNKYDDNSDGNNDPSDIDLPATSEARWWI